MKKQVLKQAINKNLLFTLLIFSPFCIFKLKAQSLKEQVINVSETVLPGAPIANVPIKVSIVFIDNGKFFINSKDVDLIECTIAGYKSQQ
ncbi:MAG: hypothetical protein JST09_18435 [Bacteroidetes bacterium]|nr:hypothetical protein [Bacteroidota bacterium]MBS1611159.1 hypothetical protein [Bacteroidota bacterium]